MGGGSGQKIKSANGVAQAANIITQDEFEGTFFTDDSVIEDLSGEIDYGLTAISSYTGQDYAQLNAILGGYYEEAFGDFVSAKELDKAKKSEKLLNKALDNIEPTAGISYRGMNNAELKQQLLSSVGGNIVMKGFQSTSLDKSIAEDFAGGEKISSIMFRISGKTGRSIGQYSQADYEKEVLFKSNTKFKIEKYDSDSDTFF